MPGTPSKKPDTEERCASPDKLNQEDTINPPQTPPRRVVASQVFETPVSRTLAVKLPYASYIDDLDILAKKELAEEIKDLIRAIYYFVIDRNCEESEGQDTFYTNLILTALHDEMYSPIVKGRNHCEKAVGVFNRLKKTINHIQEGMTSKDLYPNEINVLKISESILMGQYNLYLKSLRCFSDKTMEALMGKKNLKLENFKREKPYVLTPDQKQLILDHYPVLRKEENTPKKLTEDTKDTVNAIVGGHRRMVRALVFSKAKPLKLPPTPPKVTHGHRVLFRPNSLRK